MTEDKMGGALSNTQIVTFIILSIFSAFAHKDIRVFFVSFGMLTILFWVANIIRYFFCRKVIQ